MLTRYDFLFLIFCTQLKILFFQLSDSHIDKTFEIIDKFLRMLYAK